MLQVQSEISEAMQSNHFHSHLQKDALQTFRNINDSKEQTLENVLIIIRQKYVRPHSPATAKHKWHNLTFDPNTELISDFLEELNDCAERAFGPFAQQMIETLL